MLIDFEKDLDGRWYAVIPAWGGDSKSSISYMENGSIVYSVVCEECRKWFEENNLITEN